MRQPAHKKAVTASATAGISLIAMPDTPLSGVEVPARGVASTAAGAAKG